MRGASLDLSVRIHPRIICEDVVHAVTHSLTPQFTGSIFMALALNTISHELTLFMLGSTDISFF